MDHVNNMGRSTTGVIHISAWDDQRTTKYLFKSALAANDRWTVDVDEERGSKLTTL